MSENVMLVKFLTHRLEKWHTLSLSKENQTTNTFALINQDLSTCLRLTIWKVFSTSLIKMVKNLTKIKNGGLYQQMILGKVLLESCTAILKKLKLPYRTRPATIPARRAQRIPFGYFQTDTVSFS